MFLQINFILTDKLPIGGDDVDKGIDPGVQAGVGRVAVQLQRQRRLSPHNGPEVSDDKGIRTAGKVRYKRSKELWMTFNQACRLQNQLPHTPVHMPFVFFFIKLKEIARDYRNSPGRQLVWYAHMRFFNKSIVGPGEYDDPYLVGVSFQIGKGPG